MTTLAMLHTGPVVIGPLNELAKTILPEIRVINFLDDSVVAEIEAVGHINSAVRNRLDFLGQSAREAGADAVLITCSSISELADPVSKRCGLPVYKIDEAMAESSVRTGERIGVVATLPTTMEPTCVQIERKARDMGKRIEIHRELCREAFDHLSRGDAKSHDTIVLQAVERLAGQNDVVVLAQASMARFRDQLEAFAVPVLTSPQLGLHKVREQLASCGLLNRVA